MENRGEKNPFRQSGVVLKGEGKASKLGFPTINIHFDDPSITGTYAGKVRIGSLELNAVIYVNRKKQCLEAHIFDFTEDLYGREVEMELIQKISGSRNLNNEDEMKEKMADDVGLARNYLAGL